MLSQPLCRRGVPPIGASLVRPLLALAMCLIGLALAGCGSKPVRSVAVEDRPVAVPPGTGTGRLPPAMPKAALPPVAQALPVPSSAGHRPGFYTVQRGDTLIRIALDHGQNWRDIARWNGIDNPNLIEVGQVLRVLPESRIEARADARPDGRVESRSDPRVDPKADLRTPPSRAGAQSSPPMTPGMAASSPTTAASASTGAASGAAVPSSGSAIGGTPPAASASAALGTDASFSWPAQGPLLQGFDEQRNKGLNIGGAAGDPVHAAADGRVVYAGSALRGYGNLVIIKHNATFLTAYAHNQTLLVKEDQAVRRGQKIAEMGNSDSDRVQLHFEIRRDGKPIDPTKLLPAR